jgi:hypothetical protein
MQPDPSSGGSPDTRRQEVDMVDPTPIREHLEVVGSDGERVGIDVKMDDARARWSANSAEVPVASYREFT